MEINSPFALITAPTLTATGAQAITVNVWETFIKPPTLTGNITLNLTLGTQLRVGAKIFVQVTTTATETVTFGTGFTSGQTIITGVAGKTFSQMFIYDGTAFNAVAANKQVN
nr:hypothetical protein [uncultured Flavobacterium sp.]